MAEDQGGSIGVNSEGRGAEQVPGDLLPDVVL
jgi:hypothetical protein